MPYEEISAEEYQKRSAVLRELKFSEEMGDAKPEKYCDGDSCKVA